jgi:ABC-2 type transport system ATP-binding protein
MIEVKNIDFAYKKSRLLFEDLNMEFKEGSIYGLLGKNGSGKTTLLKLLSGLRYPLKGEILINNEKSVGRSPSYLSKLFLIPEEFDFPAIKIGSFIKIYSPFFKGFVKSQFDYYLSEFKVPSDAIITTLSLGQKKKFLLAFGLACNTDVLLMDEPTNGLDIPSKVQFRKIIAGLSNESKIFIISTHQIKDIEEIIDHITIIDEGKMPFSAEINDIIDKLAFVDSSNASPKSEDVLFEQKYFGGRKMIIRNTGNNFTQVDLEMLFNSVIENSKLINMIFENNKELEYENI